MSREKTGLNSFAESFVSPRGRSAILSLFGKGDLAKARKDLATKDEQTAGLKAQIKKLQAERAATVQRHKQQLAKTSQRLSSGD